LQWKANKAFRKTTNATYLKLDYPMHGRAGNYVVSCVCERLPDGTWKYLPNQ
jgi:hypothetical protein